MAFRGTGVRGAGFRKPLQESSLPQKAVLWQLQMLCFLQKALLFRCYLSGEGVQNLGRQESACQVELS